MELAISIRGRRVRVTSLEITDGDSEKSVRLSVRGAELTEQLNGLMFELPISRERVVRYMYAYRR